MTRRRFFAPENAFDLDGARVLLTVDEAHHLRYALRLKVNDEVYVFNGIGKEFRCVIASTAKDTAQLDIVEEVQPARPESPLRLTLGVALLKGDKFDLVVQKTTELGVQHIVPVITRYADIHLRDEADGLKRVVRWQRIALEATKQSGRAFVPQVGVPVTFSSFITDSRHTSGLMFSEREGQPLGSTEAHLQFPNIAALVGSEGGWSDEEIVQARSAGWRIVTLGGRILRAETAAITVTALLQHIFGDLR